MREKNIPSCPLHNSTVAALAKIKDYYDLTSDYYTIATVLDLQFNIRYYKQEGRNQDTALEIERVVHPIHQTIYQSGINPVLMDKTVSTYLLNVLCNKIQTPTTGFQLYLNDQTVDGDSVDDVFLWWKSNSKKYSNLSNMARYYLAIPGTSPSLERLFSSEKEFITDRDNGLSAGTITAYQCLKSWL